jgi:hypothetical protein
VSNSIDVRLALDLHLHNSNETGITERS